MDRLTYYDALAGCYKVKPDAPQGQLVQRLGAYEDRYEQEQEEKEDGETWSE